jgi:hypothetical protein
MTTNLYIPYSPKLFDGVKKDALTYLSVYPDIRVVALVLEDERLPFEAFIIVRRNGYVNPFVDESASKHFIVAESNNPILIIAAVNVAMITNGTLLNLKSKYWNEMRVFGRPFYEKSL